MVETDNFIIVYVLFCNLVAEIVQPVEWNTAFSKSNYFFTDWAVINIFQHNKCCCNNTKPKWPFCKHQILEGI